MNSPAPVPAAVPEHTLEQLVGERTVPTLWHENYWFRRHETAYLALAPRIVEALAEPAGPDPAGSTSRQLAGVVVEAGCGEGYGVGLLRRAGAGRVAALDYDRAALVHARTAYPRDVAGRAARANLAALPLADASVAAVTSFQVIEHLWTPWEFLAECARVLRPGGLLVVTTPNRPTFSPGLRRGEKPPNPFHVREFDAAELDATIAAHLRVRRLLGVSHGPRLTAWEAEHGDLIAAQLAGPPEEWPARLVELVRSVTAADFTIAACADDDPRMLDLVVLADRPLEVGSAA